MCESLLNVWLGQVCYFPLKTRVFLDSMKRKYYYLLVSKISHLIECHSKSLWSCPTCRHLRSSFKDGITIFLGPMRIKKYIPMYLLSFCIFVQTFKNYNLNCNHGNVPEICKSPLLDFCHVRVKMNVHHSLYHFLSQPILGHLNLNAWCMFLCHIVCKQYKFQGGIEWLSKLS